MAWVRIDDHFDEHPKLQKVGPLGWGVWLAGLAYSNRNLTDGFIPWTKARTLVSFEIVEEDGRVWDISRTSGMTGDEVDANWIVNLLVTAGLWDVVENGKGRTEGYQIHDYADYQPTKAQIEEERAKKVEAGRLGGLTKAGNRVAPAKQALEHSPSTSPSENVAKVYPVPVPVPNPVPKSSSVPEEEKTYVAPNGAAHGDSSKKPLPVNGAAQRIIAAFCVCAGIDEPANYPKAAGQAQKLASAGVTPEDVPSLFTAANWGDAGVDLGKMLGSVDRWRSAKKAPPPARSVKYPDPLQKRIDNWTIEQTAEGRPILPFPPPLQAAIDDYHASLQELRAR